MSEVRQVGLVVEGETDFIILEAALNRLLPFPFSIVRLQPEESVASRGEGWAGIYRWCRQVAATHARTLLDSPVLPFIDFLIIAIDADVARMTYSSAKIKDNHQDDLPCERNCLPASDTANALESVVAGWLHPLEVGAKALICIPSKSIESWVATALYAESDCDFFENIECSFDVLRYMYKKPSKQRLISQKQGRMRKKSGRYRQSQNVISERWDIVEKYCAQAVSFRESLERLCLS